MTLPGPGVYLQAKNPHTKAQQADNNTERVSQALHHSVLRSPGVLLRGFVRPQHLADSRCDRSRKSPAAEVQRVWAES